MTGPTCLEAGASADFVQSFMTSETKKRKKKKSIGNGGGNGGDGNGGDGKGSDFDGFVNGEVPHGNRLV